MIQKSGQIFLPFCHNSRVWQTDGRTDKQTDCFLIAKPRLHSMQRCKKRVRLRRCIYAVSVIGIRQLTGVWLAASCISESCIHNYIRRRCCTGLHAWASYRSHSSVSVFTAHRRTLSHLTWWYFYADWNAVWSVWFQSVFCCCRTMQRHRGAIPTVVDLTLYVICLNVKRQWRKYSQKPTFTALHWMQTPSSDEKAVCQSVCLSVPLSNAWIVTKRKTDMSRFLYRTKEHLA